MKKRRAPRDRQPTLNFLAFLTIAGTLQICLSAVIQGWGNAFTTNAPIWLMSILTAWLGSQLGWAEHLNLMNRRTIGEWMGWPVDADGRPASPPLSGRIVADTDSDIP